MFFINLICRVDGPLVLTNHRVCDGVIGSVDKSEEEWERLWVREWTKIFSGGGHGGGHLKTFENNFRYEYHRVHPNRWSLVPGLMVHGPDIVMMDDNKSKTVNE